VFFSVERFGRFCCGFWEKRVAERGFLMVNSWWNAGEAGMLMSLFWFENHATNSGFIFG
jgi:hypothetical protein